MILLNDMNFSEIRLIRKRTSKHSDEILSIGIIDDEIK